MSGGLFGSALLRETGGSLSAEQIRALNLAHAEACAHRRDTVRPLSGARGLFATLTEQKVKWAIATSGLETAARLALDMLGVPADTPLVTRDQIRHAGPDRTCSWPPANASAATSARPSSSAPASGTFSPLAAPARSARGCWLAGTDVKNLSGPAYRVYADPAELLTHLDEFGVRGDTDWVTAHGDER
jgi:hypothetical protein